MGARPSRPTRHAETNDDDDALFSDTVAWFSARTPESTVALYKRYGGRVTDYPLSPGITYHFFTSCYEDEAYTVPAALQEHDVDRVYDVALVLETVKAGRPLDRDEWAFVRVEHALDARDLDDTVGVPHRQEGSLLERLAQQGYQSRPFVPLASPRRKRATDDVVPDSEDESPASTEVESPVCTASNSRPAAGMRSPSYTASPIPHRKTYPSERFTVWPTPTTPPHIRRACQQASFVQALGNVSEAKCSMAETLVDRQEIIIEDVTDLFEAGFYRCKSESMD